jgi:flagellar biosynthesis protein FlhA
MMIVAIMIVPLPSFALDFLLTISIAIAVLIILISLYVHNPTDLTAFPTILLIVVVYRLSLNVASTKMILSNGHLGGESVSEIITAFGDFVVGGNYALGIIIFVILVIINFMVITKGSTRVAEVTARFTLDALPGKQMAIDADLNAGMIDDKEAQARRSKLQQEVSFYGAMDGSAKFVQGDAIAGIIITLVNIIGGFMIGVFQQDMAFADAAKTFTLLTIGDGLVGQIPALIISTATGIMITRTNKASNESFATATINQLTEDYKILILVGSIMFIFALVPGLPTFSLGLVAIIFLVLGLLIKASNEGRSIVDILMNRQGEITPASYTMNQANQGAQNVNNQQMPMPQEEKKSPADVQKEEQETLKEILKTEVLELSLGFELIKLADEEQGGDLLERIKGMRRTIAKDFGFIVPQIRIHDDLHVLPSTYKILLKGIEIGEGQIEYNKFLAMGNDMVVEEVEGINVKEPIFGLDATWIDKEQKDDAIMAGYTVIEPSGVVATHISEVIKNNAPDILTRQDVQHSIDRLREDYEVLVEDVLKEVNNIGLIQNVLKELLKSHIPINDMLTILETIADIAPTTKDVDIIVDYVRARLARVITNLYVDDRRVLNFLSLDPTTEQYLMDKVANMGDRAKLILDSHELEALSNVVSEYGMSLQQRGIKPILIVDSTLRKHLADILTMLPATKSIIVLSHAEIDPNVNFEAVGTISIQF